MKRLGALLFAASVFCGVLLSSGPALADAPGPRDVCDVEGQGCEQCWEHYDANEEEAAAFKKCSEPLAAKGLVEACRHRQGAGESVYFCPQGAKVEKVTVGGGCAGCSVGGGGAWGALAALALGMGLAAWRRRAAR